MMMYHANRSTSSKVVFSSKIRRSLFIIFSRLSSTFFSASPFPPWDMAFHSAEFITTTVGWSLSLLEYFVFFCASFWDSCAMAVNRSSRSVSTVG